ncbi:hypothetical protein MTR_0023s0160 [Medicago truncatula]|uniref:Uncharacterized protein n=1 Tax=Medicago truncatula TaxID=3880 RepID=A0A072TUV4_MEDTR|nr:hypothetical protein MTR_0023s0130 [Medicago truncatula]KEH17325.1 hypothetical protein MTR_0023s0160 [Medicago truncatula]
MVDVAESSDGKLSLGKVFLNDVEMVTEDHVRDTNVAQSSIRKPQKQLKVLSHGQSEEASGKIIALTLLSTKGVSRTKTIRPEILKEKIGEELSTHLQSPPLILGSFQERKISAPRHDAPEVPSRYSYNNNYKGKQPMTRTQWRRYQRQKKATALQDITNVDKGKVKQKVVFEMVKKPATERI